MLAPGFSGGDVVVTVVTALTVSGGLERALCERFSRTGPEIRLGDAAAIRRARAGAARVEQLQDGVEEGTEESVILAVDHVFPLIVTGLRGDSHHTFIARLDAKKWGRGSVRGQLIARM
ncbi:hypothetical protein GCM10020255_092300 [Rhodococcus baikonurensis]